MYRLPVLATLRLTVQVFPAVCADYLRRMKLRGAARAMNELAAQGHLRR